MCIYKQTPIVHCYLPLYGKSPQILLAQHNGDFSAGPAGLTSMAALAGSSTVGRVLGQPHVHVHVHAVGVDCRLDLFLFLSVCYYPFVKPRIAYMAARATKKLQLEAGRTLEAWTPKLP